MLYTQQHSDTLHAPGWQHQVIPAYIRAVNTSIPCSLPTWAHDLVAVRYMNESPAAIIALRHKTFSRAALFLMDDGTGAVILQFHDSRVLALDYADRKQLIREWTETRASYSEYASFNRLHSGTEGGKLVVKLGV